MKNGRKLVKVDWIKRWLDDRNAGASRRLIASSVDSGSYCSALPRESLYSSRTYRLSGLELKSKHLNLVDTLVIV
jgi:hypothetical protein